MSTITITDPNIISKLNNLIKTCSSISSTGKDIAFAQQAVNARKVLLRFLKKTPGCAVLYHHFSACVDIYECLTLAKELQCNDYTFTVPDIEKHKPGTSCDERQVPLTIQNECQYEVGSIVQLGRRTIRGETQLIDWRVIDVVGTKALLLSSRVLFWEPFDTENGTNWTTSSLRKKLNETWLPSVFSSEELSVLATPPYAVNEDQAVFLLSAGEVTSLLKNNEDRADRFATWWTCTPSFAEGTLYFVSRKGEIQEEGFISSKMNGVRPALWIDAPRCVSSPCSPAPSDPAEIVYIVQHTDGFFYITMLTSKEEPNSVSLIKKAAESTRFSTLEDANAAAMKISQIFGKRQILPVKFVRLADAICREKSQNKQHLQENAPQLESDIIIEDRDGFPLLSIDTKGVVFVYDRPEDTDCRLIDKARYRNELQTLIDAQKKTLDAVFDYNCLGMIHGYETALDCNAKFIRYEIFKAESMLEDFTSLPDIQDIFTDDTLFYKGYISALRDALNLQRNCVLSPANRDVYIINLRSDKDSVPLPPQDGSFSEYGSYHVTFYNQLQRIQIEHKKQYICIIYADRNQILTNDEITEALGLPNDDNLIYKYQMIPKTFEKLKKHIQFALRKLYGLGSGDPDYVIDSQYVPALTAYQMNANSDEDEIDDVSELPVGDYFELTGDPEKQIESKLKIKNKLYPFQFSSNCDLEDIKLPMGERILPVGLFLNCISLTNVMMPQSLQKIQTSAFEGCVSLWRVFLPDTVKTLEDRVFFGCSNLRKLFLPNSLEYIGSKCFAGCTSLTSIHFPRSIRYVAKDAFEGCVSLENVDIPENTVISFDGVENLKITYYKFYEKQAESSRKDESMFKPNGDALKKLTSDTCLLDIMDLKSISEVDLPKTLLELLNEGDSNDYTQ